MHSVFPWIKAWKKKSENQWLQRFKYNHQLQQSCRKDTYCNFRYLCCVSLLLEIYPKSRRGRILIGKLQERHLKPQHFQWLNEFRHSPVTHGSEFCLFDPFSHSCTVLYSAAHVSKSMTKVISCHSCGSQVMVLWSQIPLSSRKTVKLAKCSSISTNIWSNLIFQPPLKKWTVNSIIVWSKTQQYCWLRAMPLLGQLSFMLGNKI